MKSYREYIKEALDKPFKHKKLNTMDSTSGTTHYYGFKDDKGERTHVYISHSKHNNTAHVDFTDDEGGFEATGRGSIRHLSTVKHIMQQHAKDHPDLKAYKFTSEKSRDRSDGGGRHKLYSRLARSAGGRTEDEEHFSTHFIPVNRDKNGD